MDRVSPTPHLRIRRSIAALFGVLLYAAALSTPVRAHDIPDEIMLRSFVKPDGDWLHVLVRIPLPMLLTPDLRSSELGRMDDKFEEATAAFARQVVFYEDDRPLVRETPSRARIALPSDPSFESFESAFDNIRGPALPTGTQVSWTDGYFDAYLRYPISSDNSAFAMDIALDGGRGGRLKMFVRFITPDGTIRAYELHGGSGLFLLDPGWYRAAWTFGELGFEHILGGIDHLLFLLCLVIPFGLAHFRALVAVISTFTVAHSITLIASASGLAPAAEWFPPLVEALIALSILYMALENIILALREGRNADAGMLRRCLVVGAFGLVHGFGFSFILSQQLQFAGNHLLLSLLSFNLGVEIGQIAFLAVALPLLSVGLREKDGRPIGIVIVSTLVAHVAWHWLSERWETLAMAVWPLVDDVDAARGDAAQQRPSGHQPQKQWQRGLLPAAQHAADHAILQEHLQALRKTGRQLPPPLHCVKLIGGDRPLQERGGQDVGRGDGILDGEIDPDTADRRHRVGGVTDA